MNDHQATVTLEGVLALAHHVRTGTAATAKTAAQQCIQAAGGDPLVALIVATALIPTDRPVRAWWHRLTTWQAGLLPKAACTRCGHHQRAHPPIHAGMCVAAGCECYGFGVAA